MNIEQASSLFYNEFMKSISDNILINDTSNVCMITNEPLELYSIKLNCGHQFNYKPLYNSVIAYLNNQYHKSKQFYIECPYCRQRTRGVLPYVPELSLSRITRVNSPYTQSIGINSCIYINKLGVKCDRRCYYDKCMLHLSKPQNKKNKKSSKITTKQVCNGITLKGQQCKRSALNDTTYCKIHTPKSNK
jgi:hypothetical protein